MPSIINATTTNGVAISPDNSGSLQLATNNGTTAVTIDTSQNVGIGTSSPSRRLMVEKSAGAVGFGSPYVQVGAANYANGGYYTIGFGYVGGSYTTAPAEIGAIATDDSGGGKVALTFATRDVTTNTAPTERMRITSAGIAQINTTAAAPSIGVDAKLMVKGGDGVIECYSNSNGAGYYGITFKNNNANNSGIQGYVTINATTVAYTSVSDYRLKENVKPMTGGLDTVCKLKPVTYNWKSDGSSGQGFLAHEVQELVPEAVNGEKDDVNADGSIKAQGLDTSFLVATLTAAIQELKAELDTVKAELNTLKNPPVEGTE